MHPAGAMQIVPLDPSRVDEAAAVLARAFQNDPLQSYTFPDPLERARLGPAFFAPLVRCGLLGGEVWTTRGPLDAVAIWWPPSHASLDAGKLEEAGFFALAGVIGAEAFSRFSSVIDYVEPLHKRDMSEPHWYAMVIGVDPPRQGRGVGTRLMEPVLDRADADGLPCYLETTQPRNISFYGKQGFEVLVEGTEPRSGVAFWTFRRDPAPPEAA